MTTPEITRIRAALERYKAAGNRTAEAYASVLELDGSTSTEALTAVLAHIDAQQAEIEKLRVDAELWRKHDADKTARYALFIAKLNDGETP